MGHWTYALLFLGAALESAAFLGFLIPGETIVVLGGVLASMGVLALPETVAIAVSGAIIGDNVGYYLGHRLGRPWLERHPRLARSHGNLIERVDEVFERHGGKAVLVGRFVGFLRALLPFVAGGRASQSAPGTAAFMVRTLARGSCTMRPRWRGMVRSRRAAPPPCEPPPRCAARAWCC